MLGIILFYCTNFSGLTFMQFNVIFILFNINKTVQCCDGLMFLIWWNWCDKTVSWLKYYHLCTRGRSYYTTQIPPVALPPLVNCFVHTCRFVKACVCLSVAESSGVSPFPRQWQSDLWPHTGGAPSGGMPHHLRPRDGLGTMFSAQPMGCHTE